MSDKREVTELPIIRDVNPPGTLEWLAELVRGYPPHDEYGIDYTKAVDCPIVTCVVYYDGDVLLVHRSSDVLVYPNTWAQIGGFMRIAPPAEQALEELSEEVGIQPSDIKTLTVARRRLRLDPELRVDQEFSAPVHTRRWHEFRTAVELRRRVEPVTNWENRSAQWVPLAEVSRLPLLRSSRRTLEAWHRSSRIYA